MTREHLKFKLVLEVTYVSIPPKLEIYVDDNFKYSSHSMDSNREHTIIFDHVCDFGEHELKIVRSRKFDTAPEQTVELKNVIIDGVDIRNIIWINSYNENVYPEPWATQQLEQGNVLEKQVIGETVFGHNCTWRLPFTSPFYEYVMDWLR